MPHQFGLSSRAVSTSLVSHEPLRSLAKAAVCGLSLLAVSGCFKGDRPTLGPVHGCVTLDGKPLANARIIFKSQEVNVRESWAVTNADGEYVLRYIRDDLGGTIGKNSVRISKQTPNARSEMLPEKYNTRTTLTADVKQGANEINFDLTLDPK